MSESASHDPVKPSHVRIAAGVAVACAAVVAVAIFVLTEQAPETTSAESTFVNELLIKLFGGIPGLYDPTTELWAGIHVRHWAHAVEFGALGLFVALAAVLISGGRPLWIPSVLSLVICAGSSLIDQCHKLFVPGRHFDTFDLAMDALGYGVAIALVLLFSALHTVKKHDK